METQNKGYCSIVGAGAEDPGGGHAHIVANGRVSFKDGLHCAQPVEI